MNTAKLKVEGMRCDGCALILHDPQSVAEDQLVETIEKAGYRVAAKS